MSDGEAATSASYSSFYTSHSYTPPSDVHGSTQKSKASVVIRDPKDGASTSVRPPAYDAKVNDLPGRWCSVAWEEMKDWGDVAASANGLEWRSPPLTLPPRKSAARQTEPAGDGTVHRNTKKKGPVPNITSIWAIQQIYQPLHKNKDTQRRCSRLARHSNKLSKAATQRPDSASKPSRSPMPGAQKAECATEVMSMKTPVKAQPIQEGCGAIPRRLSPKEVVANYRLHYTPVQQRRQRQHDAEQQYFGRADCDEVQTIVQRIHKSHRLKCYTEINERVALQEKAKCLPYHVVDAATYWAGSRVWARRAKPKPPEVGIPEEAISDPMPCSSLSADVCDPNTVTLDDLRADNSARQSPSMHSSTSQDTTETGPQTPSSLGHAMPMNPNLPSAEVDSQGHSHLDSSEHSTSSSTSNTSESTANSGSTDDGSDHDGVNSGSTSSGGDRS